MSKIDYILTLCAEISAQGKTPSIALIRNMAKHPVAIPEVVKALQHWKSHPKTRPTTAASSIASKADVNLTIEQRVTELESQVAKMSQLLIDLNATKL